MAYDPRTTTGIPTEPVGSLPRSARLQAAYADFDAGKITKEQLEALQDDAVRDSISRNKLVHDPIISHPPHSTRFIRVCVVSPIASQSLTQFGRPTLGSVVNGLSLRGVGQPVGASGPKVPAAKGQVQHPNASVGPRASKPPPNPTKWRP